ncbi:MAG: aminotransferase class V-fold PLP-dependent enzyme [Acidobacteria bacterium]|nr:aminotransferase class V-fold PLP-dependent enzyme [Acidobacteriota bacterium]
MISEAQQERKFLDFRQAFPAYSQGIYVNHAAVSPAAVFVRQRMMDFWQRRANFPVDIYPELQEGQLHFKEQIARMIHAEGAENIACVENTSTGLNMVAGGLEWKAGDRILLNTMEFPANVYPFLNLQRQGVMVDFINPEAGGLTLDRIVERVQPRTRLISISFVQFLNGFRADLAALGRFCRAQGIHLVVDAIQGTGAIPLDVQCWGYRCLGHRRPQVADVAHGDGFSVCRPPPSSKNGSCPGGMAVGQGQLEPVRLSP